MACATDAQRPAQVQPTPALAAAKISLSRENSHEANGTTHSAFTRAESARQPERCQGQARCVAVDIGPFHRRGVISPELEGRALMDRHQEEGQ